MILSLRRTIRRVDPHESAATVGVHGYGCHAVSGRDDHLKRAARRYALLQKLYPREYRRTFGDQMLQSFKDQYRAASQDGGVGFRFWVSVAGDEARSIATEHIQALHLQRVLLLLMLLGVVEFAAIAPFRLKHIPVLMLAALAILPFIGILSAVLLATLLVKAWVKKWQIVAGIFLLGSVLGAFGIQSAVRAATTNTWCTTAHIAHSQPPATLVSATDYFAQGDYDYDRGACAEAISAYTSAIDINPAFAEAYNNRAYTYMMEQDYTHALPDLDRAIQLRPDYVNALMNRGDIYNFDQIDRPRAIADYERVVALGPTESKNTQVCGHLFLAEHNGWHLNTLLDLPRAGC